MIRRLKRYLQQHMVNQEEILSVLKTHQMGALSAALRTSAWAMRNDLIQQANTFNSHEIRKHGFKCYSQNDEDGIIQEIFSRIGVIQKTFLEVGVGTGTECNSAYLLANGWTGTWVDASDHDCRVINHAFAPLVNARKLKVVNTFIDCNNAPNVLDVCSRQPELDLFSLDIDGNDYHILKVIEPLTPRVIVVEYNSKFRPPSQWVMPYDATHTWQGDDYQGASLSALANLLGTKGYTLIGCNITGANAFFVRTDLVGDRFTNAGDLDALYEPPRYWMNVGLPSGHSPSSRSIVAGGIFGGTDTSDGSPRRASS